MSDPKAEQTRLDLIGNLEEATTYLREYGKLSWVEQVDSCRKRIEARDFNGIEQLLRCFGGMGSITDIVISPHNGDDIAPDQIDKVNDHWRELISSIFRLADSLRRDASP